MASNSLIRWERNRGRNGFDMPGDLLENQTAESFNVLVGDSSVGTKRSGTASQTLTGDSFSGLNALGRFIAGQDDTAAQTFIVSRDATTKILRVTGGTAATNLTLISAVLATAPWNCSFATLNGKFYICIRLSANVNRTLVYDPAYSTSAIRYAGILAPAAPSVANTGGGTYAATIRYYRIAWREVRSGVIIRESLYGPATTFTPSGAGTAARITKPTGTSPAEGETHWVVAGSADNLAFYELSQIVIGTTTYDDSALPSSYGANAAIASEGANTPLAAFKFIVATDDRLIFFGAYEPGLAASAVGTLVTKDGCVYFTPVLDSSVLHDDERISNTTTFKGRIGISRNGGSEDRALMGPLDGRVFACQSRGITMLIPTGDATAPYKKRTLSKTLGAVNNQSWFIGEDENGALCVYWLDPARGPYRYGPEGVQWCGYDVLDLWQTVNLSATGSVAHGVFHDELKLAIWWITTGASNDPDKIICFRVQEGRAVRDLNGTTGVRYGWMQWSVPSASERCSAMLPSAFAAAMSRKFKPYAGDASVLARLDDDSATQDLGVSFQGYATSGAFRLTPETRIKKLHRSYVLADVNAGVTVQQSLIRNYGAETRVSDALLTAIGSETRILKRFGNSGANDSALADAFTFQVQLGDAAAQNVALWALHDWLGLIETTDADTQ